MSFSLPTNCPSCGFTLVWVGVDLVCKNDSCGSKQFKSLASFLIKCGVEGVTETSLENWNISSVPELLKWSPDPTSKNHQKFAFELLNKVFTKPKEELFACMTFNGAGETNVTKLIEHYGNGKVETASRVLYFKKEYDTFPEGIGQKVIDKIEGDWVKNLYLLKAIMDDFRYNPVVKPIAAVASGNLSGKSFLITGTLTEKRNVVENKIKAAGGTIAGSVSKNLDYLVVGSDAGSKLEKAQKLGVKILTEDELKGMI